MPPGELNEEEIFQPEPANYRQGELVHVLEGAYARGFRHVYMGGAIYSIGAAIAELRERFAVEDLVRIRTRQVIQLPIVYG